MKNEHFEFKTVVTIASNSMYDSSHSLDHHSATRYDSSHTLDHHSATRYDSSHPFDHHSAGRYDSSHPFDHHSAGRYDSSHPFDHHSAGRYDSSHYEVTVDKVTRSMQCKSDNELQLPWIEKYRPKKIDQIISHQEIIKSLKKFIALNTFPHLLFFGPSGSGKTSTIICCAHEIYGQYRDYMTLQLNASNERGIETVRTKIKNFVANKNSIFLPVEFRNIFKLVILDEIDSMTVEAQGMLRQTIEKNSVTTRFCLICNDIDKINIALQSRCTLFRFSPLNSHDMHLRLSDICDLESIKYDRDAIDAIIKISKNDMRSAINSLQYIDCAYDKRLTVENIYLISGYCMPAINHDIFAILLDVHKNKTKLREAVDRIIDIVVDNNITVFNLLDELKNIVLASKFSNSQKIYLIDHLAQNEIYDAANVDLSVIVMIIASLFVVMREMI